jgi:hypothetical protein
MMAEARGGAETTPEALHVVPGCDRGVPGKLAAGASWRSQRPERFRRPPWPSIQYCIVGTVKMCCQAGAGRDIKWRCPL